MEQKDGKKGQKKCIAFTKENIRLLVMSFIYHDYDV